MAESDDEYVQAISEDEGAAPKTNGYGTRGQSTQATGIVTRERWEDVQRSWDQVVEGADGTLAGSVEGLVEAGKRRRILKDTTPIQRGIIRNVILLLDLSMNMSEKDLRPTRHLLTIRHSTEFVRDFFEQNPISQLGILGTREGLCIRISDMSGNPAQHIAALAALREKEPAGGPSLQNSLEMARANLAAAPSHGTREVIIIYGALNTADPGDIHGTIRSLVREHICVSVIGLAARLYICSEIVAKTNGLSSPSDQRASSDALYGVALDEAHFRTLLLGHTTPPAITITEQATRPPSLLMMGFPSRVKEDHPSFCACHAQVTLGGFLCTRCSAKVCALPCQCPTCGLQLIQSTHLARSYHHIFPLTNFVEVPWSQARKRSTLRCFACLTEFPPLPSQNDHHTHASQNKDSQARGGASESSRYACTNCREHFCIDCDVFAHEVTHNCPGCLSKQYRPETNATMNGHANGADDMEIEQG